MDYVSKSKRVNAIENGCVISARHQSNETGRGKFAIAEYTYVHTWYGNIAGSRPVYRIGYGDNRSLYWYDEFGTLGELETAMREFANLRRWKVVTKPKYRGQACS